MISEIATKPIPFEIKSGMTRQENFFSNLRYWQKLTDQESTELTVIYGGEENFATSNGNYVSWRRLESVF